MTSSAKKMELRVDEFFRNNPDLLEDDPYRQNNQNPARLCLIEISNKSNSKSIHEKCQDCDTEFSNTKDLETHMKNAHNAEKCDLETSENATKIVQVNAV